MVSKASIQALLNKSLKPYKDINFIRTRFYKTWRRYYGHLQKFDIPNQLVQKLHKNRFYPIKLAENSQIYFFKIHSIHRRGEFTYAKCLVYIRYNDLPTSYFDQVGYPAQFLQCEKYVKIPAKLLIFYILTTKYQSWKNPLVFEDTMEILDFPIEIVHIDQFSLIFSFKKSLESKKPFRRLPGDSCTSSLKHTNLGEEVKIHDFVDPNTKYLGFYSDYFEFAESLLRTPLDFKNRSCIFEDIMDHEKMKLYIEDHLNSVIDSNSSSINDKSSRETENTQHRQKIISSILLNEQSTSSSSQDTIDKPSIHIPLDDTSPGQLTADSAKKSYETTNKPISSDEFSRPRMRQKVLKHEEIKENGRKRNGDRAKPKDDFSDSTSTNRDRRSAITIRIIKEGEDAETFTPKNSAERPLHNPEPYNTDYNIHPDYSSHKSTLKKILKQYTDSKVFYKDYEKFYYNLNNHLPRIPKMGWLEVDVFKLFRETIKKGGYHEVTSRLMWKDIYKSLNSKTIVSNAATTVKTHYKKLLYHFEEYLFSKDKKHHLSKSGESNIQPFIGKHKNIRVVNNTLGNIHQPNHAIHNEFLMNNALSIKESEYSLRLCKSVFTIASQRPTPTDSIISIATPVTSDNLFNYRYHMGNQIHRGCNCQYNFNPCFIHQEFVQRSPIQPLPAHLYYMAERQKAHYSPLPNDARYINNVISQLPSPSHLTPMLIHHTQQRPPNYTNSYTTQQSHKTTKRARNIPVIPPNFGHIPTLPTGYRHPYKIGIRPPESCIYPQPYYDNTNRRRVYKNK